MYKLFSSILPTVHNYQSRKIMVNAANDFVHLCGVNTAQWFQYRFKICVHHKRCSQLLLDICKATSRIFWKLNVLNMPTIFRVCRQKLRGWIGMKTLFTAVCNSMMCTNLSTDQPAKITNCGLVLNFTHFMQKQIHMLVEYRVTHPQWVYNLLPIFNTIYIDGNIVPFCKQSHRRQWYRKRQR